MRRDLAYHLRHCVTHRLTVNDGNVTEARADKAIDVGDAKFWRERASRRGILGLSSTVKYSTRRLNSRGDCAGYSIRKCADGDFFYEDLKVSFLRRHGRRVLWSRPGWVSLRSWVDEEKNAARYLTFQILSNLCEDCECINSIHRWIKSLWCHILFKVTGELEGYVSMKRQIIRFVTLIKTL